MRRLISWLQSLQVRQIFSICLVGVTFLMINAFNGDRHVQAIAETLPPDTNDYQLRRTAANIKSYTKHSPSDNYIENVQQSLKNTAEHFQKLNLDALRPYSENSLNESQDTNEKAVKSTQQTLEKPGERVIVK